MKNNIFILSFCFVLFITSILPSLLKTYFVSESGSLTIIGPVVGSFLAFGIYYKWKHIDKIFYIIFIPTILVDIFLLPKINSNIFPFGVIVSLHILILFVFNRSKTINKHFVKLVESNRVAENHY